MLLAPKQATSIFPDKLLLLSRHLEKRLLLPNLSPYEMFVAARDQAFFKCLFFPGDRVGDLGLVKTPEIACFPDDSGLLSNHVWAPQICSECVVLQIRPYARFWLLKCMSLCQERLVLTFLGVTCSGLQIRRVSSLISLSPVPRQNLV